MQQRPGRLKPGRDLKEMPTNALCSTLCGGVAVDDKALRRSFDDAA